MAALEKGCVNLAAHISNLNKYGVPVVVAINHFNEDTEEEIAFVEKLCRDNGAEFALTDCFKDGGKGSVELAEKVVAACEKENNFHHLYSIDAPIYDKIETIAREIYGADGVEYTKEARQSIEEFSKLAQIKCPFALPKLNIAFPIILPSRQAGGFKITVSSVDLSNGAGFLVCRTGSIMTMPGLSKTPAAFNIDIDENGNTVGLF
jgi:formate--tetrahydrofolate ligase